MTDDRKLTGGHLRGTVGYTNLAGQSPDAGPIERWQMGAIGREVAVQIEWRKDADEPSPMVQMDLYHAGELLASGEAHADYGMVQLLRDLLAKAPPVHRQEVPLRDDGTGWDGFHRV